MIVDDNALCCVLQMFRQLHHAYVEMLCNPFYIPGETITSRLITAVHILSALNSWSNLLCRLLGSAEKQISAQIGQLQSGCDNTKRRSALGGLKL